MYMLKSLLERKSHIDLSNPCQFEKSRPYFKKYLANFLNVTEPKGRILVCHACNNTKYSNVRHMYFGTDYENIVVDGSKFNTFEDVHTRTLKKYGEEKTRELKKLGDKSKGGKANKGIKKSEEHKRKISEAIKKWHQERKI